MPADVILRSQIMPIALANIGWRTYFMNASWDVIIVGLIVSFRSAFIIAAPPVMTF